MYFEFCGGTYKKGLVLRKIPNHHFGSYHHPRTLHCSHRPLPLALHSRYSLSSLAMPISDRSRNGSPLRPAFIATSSYKPDSMQVADELHPVIHSGRVAVITGAASGIGRAAALEFAKSV